MSEDPNHRPYREIRPPATLAGLVACGWVHAGSDEGHAVLPDGCVDILLDLQRSRARVIGTMTRPLTVPPGAASVVALRLHPGAAGRVFGPGVHEWTDDDFDLADRWPEAGALVHQVAQAEAAGRVPALLAALTRRRPPAVDRRIGAAVRWLAERRGSVRELSAALGISRQYLTRHFKSHVGVGPKMLARVFRLQELIATVERQPELPWPLAAVGSGYCDQAHMIDEFKALTGSTPVRWKATRAEGRRDVPE